MDSWPLSFRAPTRSAAHSFVAGPHGSHPLFGGRRAQVDPAVRQAALLFTAAGLIGLFTDRLPNGPGNVNPLAVGIDGLNLCLGILLHTPLSRRLSRRVSLIFPLIAFAGVAVSNVLGNVPAATLGVWFVLVFIWIGSWHPKGVTLLLSPFAAAAYLLPLQYGAPTPPDAYGAVFLVLPVSVLVGEVIAANAQAARVAARHQQAAVDALARANLTDDLTGLGNRRSGNHLLESLLPGDAVAILDLDHFKRVNDEHGHAAGDALLQELGAYLQISLRPDDRVARMGGEEFMVTIRQSSADEAANITRRLLQNWRARTPLSTLSAGVAVYDGAGSPADTYRQADAALYLAKDRGRDQLAAGPEVVQSLSGSTGMNYEAAHIQVFQDLLAADGRGVTQK